MIKKVLVVCFLESTTAVSNSYANEYNKWTSNSDEAESADVITFDGSIMEGVGICNYEVIVFKLSKVFLYHV